MVESVVELARSNPEWVLVIAFVIAGAESIIGVGALLPSTIIIVSLASLGGLAGQNLVVLWLAVGLGAWVGDWASYFMGYYFEKPLRRVWPLSRRPELLTTTRAFFDRWGVASLFISRFVWAARSMVMFVAGVVRMPRVTFGVASLVSALLWAAVVLYPISFAARWLFA
ncbi:MAG: DedA family protein [Hyphomicrobiales bacterium]|nr:DedA family protein [Hyphomicrobiales bacterium]